MLASNHDDCEDSNEQDLVLPSIEGLFGSYIKSEPDEDLAMENPHDTLQEVQSHYQVHAR
jgi:hypothetical protein